MTPESAPRPKQDISLRATSCRYGGEQFAVFIGKEKATPWIRDEAKAQETLLSVIQNYRPCIWCRGYFLSDGIWNRMCGPCRRRSSDAGMV